MPSIPRPRQARPGTTFIIAFLAICALGIFSLAFSSTETSPGSSFVQSRSLDAWENENSDCRKVHKQQDKCAWVLQHCADEDAGLISYLDLYYCKLANAKPLGFAIIAAWTALLFSTIGIAASDFFCVNLSTISTILGISENMAGVTFLAFGNGSPDVFSTFAAIRSNSGSLAVGELIGAAGFITAVVAGCMALVRPFKVARKSFVRDVSFFAVSIAFSMVFCANGKLEIWECAVMVAYYIFYVMLVVVWHWWLGRRRLQRERDAIARGHYVAISGTDELEFEGERRPEEEQDETTPLQPEAVRQAPPDDFIDLEHADTESDDVLEQLEDGQQRQQWLGEINSSMRITQTPIAERRNVSSAIRPSLVGALEFQATLSSIQRSRNIRSIPLHLRRYSDGPALTLAQQKSHRHQNDVGTIHPDPTSATPVRRGTAAPNLSRSDTHLDVSSRIRARSANAADRAPPANGARSSSTQRNVRNLDVITPTRAFPPVGGKIHGRASYQMQSPGAATLESADEAFQGARQSYKQRHSRTPTISVNAPDEDTENQVHLGEDAPLLSHPMEHGMNTMTPAETHTESRATSEPRHSRPRLHITPPCDMPQSRAQSPRLSPFPALSDGSVSPRPTSIVLGPPAVGLDDIPCPADERKISLAWWPYKYFAPPREILRTLLPTLSLWREKNIWGKLVGIAAAPSFLLLTLTLPVVEPQASEIPPPVSASPLPESSKSKSGPSSFLEPSSTLESRPARSRRASTAHMAVQNEQRHRHSFPLSPFNRSSGLSSEAMDPWPEHPHAAVTSPTSWNRWLVMIQCFTAPYLVLLSAWANFYEADPALILRPSLICVLCSVAVLLIVVTTTSSSQPPRWHWLLCFVGFVVSITWISAIANEVVGVLKAIGVIFNISEAVLGLTIFAVANSLGDLVANITVARLGFPVMALSACFGGPMLNILIGIGLSGLYMTISGAEKRKHKHPEKGLHFKPYHIEVSTTLLISASALLVTLLGLLIAVPLNNWKMDRKIGCGLIILWVISTIGNLGVEISGVGDLW